MGNLINNPMSDAELVTKFTRETGSVIPKIPEPMNSDEVYFLVKMLIDEILELTATVSEPTEAKIRLISTIVSAKNIEYRNLDTIEKIAEQGDALVDMYYYSLNAAAKKGLDLSSIFQVVHQANMNKKDPVTGKFIRREDGKIMKPPGWKEPDIIGEIIRQSNLSV